MQQVIYSSAAIAPFSESALSELLAAARINNGRLGVTGMLLYNEGSFLQVLEGDENVLESLYAQIGADKRHHRMVALLRRQVDARHFDQWQMGFASMKALPENMPGYSDYLRLRGDPIESANVAARLLGAFRADASAATCRPETLLRPRPRRVHHQEALDCHAFTPGWSATAA